MIIDPHVHVWTHDPRYPWARETTHPPAQDATPEMLLQLMEANGVEKTVIIQVIHYRWDNSYLADVLKRYPTFFRGVARVNPEDPAAPDQLSKLVREQGFAGVRISPAAERQGDWIGGPLMEPLWRRCSEEGASMSVLAPVARIPEVAALIEKFPDLDVVIDHMADCPCDRPESLKHLLALKRYPRVFVKVSHTWSLSRQPYPYPDCQAQVQKIYEAFGPRRLMWGTDWPLVEGYCGYARALSIIRDGMPFLNAEDKEWMLGKTVSRVFGFEGNGC
ncbi:MAG: amidohydrolase [Acidobacteriota bacterium]|nr:amidohydrolase [Acidobacteriota bacterium]